MRIARFATSDSEPSFGVVHGDPGAEEVFAIKGDPFYQQLVPTGVRHPLEEVRLLAPIIPRSKVVGVGRNYADHAAELGNEVPPSPLLFFKPNTAVIGPTDPVLMPEFSEEISYEAELAVVIGKICKDVAPDRVKDVIFGYTCGNDVTARDIQRTDNQWARAKGFDTSCPLGPWIETDLDPDNLRITGSLDGDVVQDGSTSDMIFGVTDLVVHASQAFTLLPGDVILTGTPAGVGTIRENQRFEVEIEGIGALSNLFLRR
ncbi:fumarylacetoacetate hydrolase family protein [Tersicoccus sp. MR15.9]|uniref:fumarylacetoacetate hydrolase family protein n=1 Tax=Tersicoccus mangrovi TaxID=3121635 RepID=UPI002FE5EB9E